MAQDPTTEKVTARVVFVGVMFGCINTDDHNNKRYEIGMIECPPEHSPEIRITKNGDASKPFTWPEGHDLIFKVVNPKEKGVRLHLPEDDPRSFSFVLDVEGPDLHSEGIKVDTARFYGRRIGVTDGLLYTHELTEVLDLNTWTEAHPQGTFVKTFGKIAKQVGLNIECPEGEENGIEIVDAVTGERLGDWMPALPGVQYTIDVNNDCARATNDPTPNPSTPGSGSDFRLNYKVISPADTKDTRRFDFVRKLERGVRPPPNPDVCNQSGGGRTTSIGFDWSRLED